MSAPRHAHLVDKAVQAAVSAIEVYNKPGFHYREETFAILMLNAWELLLKARILLENKNKLRSIEVWEPRKTKAGELSKRSSARKNRAGNAMTIGINRAASLVRKYSKHGIDQPCFENIGLLVEIRDNAIHFHNAGNGLRKRVQEIGAAAVRNFVYAAEAWFDRNLESYKFALLPFAFESPMGVMQAVFSDSGRGGAGKLQALLAAARDAFPFDSTKPYNVGVEVELRFVRKADLEAIAVRIAPSDPKAVPVVLSEIDVLKGYAWRYADLRRALRKRYTNFKENDQFHRLRKPLETDKKYCHFRQLDPNNKNSSVQKFYSPNIVAEFDRHYSLAK